jgi:hypothetical protein
MDKATFDKSVIIFEELFFLEHLRTKYTKTQFEEHCRETDRVDSLDLYKAFCKGEKRAAKIWKKMLAELKESRKEETKRIRNIKMDIV